VRLAPHRHFRKIGERRGANWRGFIVLRFSSP
jgi:hypothetical protein